MSLVLRLLSGIFLFCIVVLLLYLIRRRSVNAKYSLFWVFVCAALILFDIFPSLLVFFSTLFGFHLPSNFFLTGIIFLLICVSIHFSVVLTRTEQRVRSLIEKGALLEDRIGYLEKKSDSDIKTDVIIDKSD
ncbi:MAG: DUF2304 domain-containing protein [Bifidobacteriaceae bacterium]|nr:DUF2304 domain-containing protein [Bifidobacteriaceae bacterium]